MSRILDAAVRLCLTQGSADAEQVAVAVELPDGEVRNALCGLVRQGKLIQRPGDCFARPLVRPARRLPGESYVSDLARLPLSLLMGARA